jgi:hypothetical protein
MIIVEHEQDRASLNMTNVSSEVAVTMASLAESA